MKSTTFTSFYSISAVVLLLTIHPAAADTTESFSTTVNSAQFPFTGDLTLPAFDTTLGTLQAVDLTIEADTTADVRIFNTLSSAKSFTNAQASIVTTVTTPDGTLISVTDTASAPNGTAAPGLNDFPGIQATGSHSVQIDPSDFGAWEGNSSQTVTLDDMAEDGAFSGSSVSGVFFGGIAIVDLSATVVYSYTSASNSITGTVPEPSTWALLLGGLGLLAYWRFRGRMAS